MKAHSIWLVIGLILLALSPLQSQEARGTLLGRVTDATGSVIIRAKVVESRGFKTNRRAGIVVRESDRVTIDMAMEIGEASQSVQVNAETPLLDASTASMGMVVERRAITLRISFQGRHGAHHGHSNAGRDLHAPNGRICAPVRYELALNYVGQWYALGKQRVHGRRRE